MKYKFFNNYLGAFLVFLSLMSLEILAQNDISIGISSNKIGPMTSSNKIFTNEARIIIDSIVINDPNNTIEENQNIKKLGTYKYELMSVNNNAKSLLLDLSIDPKLGLKLAKLNNGNLLISNGSLFIKFQESQNMNDFANEFQLSLIKDYSSMNTGLFATSSFDVVNTLINLIQLDPRVEFIELNLIDPFIGIR